MNHRTRGKGNQNIPNQATPSIWKRLIQYVKAQLEKRRAKKNEEKPEDRAARKTATATVWMAFFAFVATAVAIEQGLLLRQADQTARNVQRAFVSFTDFYYRSEGNPKDGVIKWDIVPVIENSGVTPTRNAYLFVSWIGIQDSLPATYYFPDIPRDPAPVDKPSRLSLGPKAKLAAQRAIIPIADLVKAFAHSEHIYIWGWVDYDDTLGGTARHRTEFAVELNVIQDPRLPGPGPFDVRQLESHNCADDECGERHPQPYPPAPHLVQ